MTLRSAPIRSLLRAPGFTLIAMLTLALGIGLSTAVFTVADGILLRRLPMGDQDRLVVLWSETRGQTASWPFELADAQEMARRAGALEQAGFVAYYGSSPQTIRDGDQVYRLGRSMVSGNFFDVLQSRPILGRALRAEDDLPGAEPVAVLGNRAWKHRFGSDSTIVGHRLLNYESERSYRIVGVMPAGLEYPRGTDFWAPLVATSSGTSDSIHLTSPILHLVGRLRPGATAADAEREVTGYFQRPEAPAWSRDFHGVGNPLRSLVLGRARPVVLMFAAAAGLLLLLTCINVATLLLVRGLGRTRELAVRAALGARRWRLVSLLLAESAILAVGGGLLGIALAAGAVRGFIGLAPGDIPRLDEIRVNLTVILGAVGITALATTIFALVPALTTSRVRLQHVLRSGGQGGGGRRPRMATEGLVALQIGLAVMVLFAAGLIGNSLIRLQRVDLAYEPHHVLIGELALRIDGPNDPARQLRLLDRVLDQVSAIPGVSAVSPALNVPFAPAGFGIEGFLRRPGQTDGEATGNPVLNMEVIAPNYFATLDIPVLKGRAFTDADREGTAPVVVLSETAARHYWPSGNPLGQQLVVGPKDPLLTVVGIVPETRYRELREARASAYFPVRQSTFGMVPWTLVVRTTGEPAAIVSALREGIATVDRGLTLLTAAPLETLLAEPRAQPQLNAVLLTGFAAAAVLLAAVGLFGVISTMVRQRTRELGIRMALGAPPAGLHRLVMRRGLAIAAAGTVAGIAGSLLTSRWLVDLLFEVSASDPLTLVLAAGLALGTAVVACLAPARASTTIDPMVCEILYLI